MDMFGGQSIACFDYAMAEGVRKTFKKEFLKNLETFITYEWDDKDIVDSIMNVVKSHPLPTYKNYENAEKLLNNDKLKNIQLISKIIVKTLEAAEKRTENETWQAMESVIFNLNSMASRAGAQVPFSSLNFGTDTTPEGRLVIEKLLLAVDKGLGNGETPIFPITVFKLKSGVNYNPDDTSYDLFKLAMKVSAKRLFPNFVNIDAPFNLQYYVPGDPRTEISAMGCRTRVISNVNGPEIVTSRGNFSFTTLNLPKIAIESKKNIKKFYELLDKYMDIAKKQLTWRYNLISKRHVYNFPFLMEQHIWLDSENLQPYDTIEKVLKHSSLSIGFCGLAECLKYLTGFHHGESETSQKLGLEIISHMREMTDSYTKKTHLNWSLFATPELKRAAA